MRNKDFIRQRAGTIRFYYRRGCIKQSERRVAGPTDDKRAEQKVFLLVTNCLTLNRERSVEEKGRNVRVPTRAYGNHKKVIAITTTTETYV